MSTTPAFSPMPTISVLAHLVGDLLAELPEVHLGGLVGAVLAPHHGVHRQLGAGRATAEDLADLGVLVGLEPELRPGLLAVGVRRRRRRRCRGGRRPTRELRSTVRGRCSVDAARSGWQGWGDLWSVPVPSTGRPRATVDSRRSPVERRPSGASRGAACADRWRSPRPAAADARLGGPWRATWTSHGAGVPARRRRAGRRAQQRRRAPRRGAAAGPRSWTSYRRPHDGGEGGLMGIAVSPTFRPTAGCTSSSPPRATTASSGSGTSAAAVRSAAPGPHRHPAAARRTTAAASGSPATRSLFATTGDTRDSALAAGQDIAGRQGPADEAGRHGAARQPVRQPRLLLRAPQRRGHHRRRRAAGSGPASSARTPGTSSTGSCPGRNYGWPRAEGTDGAGGHRDPLVQWHPDVLLPQRRHDDRAAGPGWARCAASALVGRHRPAARCAARPATSTATFGRIRNVKRAPDGSLWLDHQQRRRHRQGPPGHLRLEPRVRESASGRRRWGYT